MPDILNNLLDTTLWVSLPGILVSVWLATVVARKAAATEVATALNLATRQELAARHGTYRDEFRQLLDFLNPKDVPLIDELLNDEEIGLGLRGQIAHRGSVLEHRARFLADYGFTTELELLSHFFSDRLDACGNSDCGFTCIDASAWLRRPIAILEGRDRRPPARCMAKGRR